METLANLFPQQIAATLKRQSADWLDSNRDHVLQMAGQCGVSVDAVKTAIDNQLAGHDPLRRRQLSVSVVVPCHNLARYLGDALESVRKSTRQPDQLVVIDDASDDHDSELIRSIAAEHNATHHRVDFRDVHRVRQFGLSLLAGNAGCVLFLDADNKVAPDYLQHCVDRLIADPDAGIVFPVLHAFGDASGPWHQTEKAPDVVRADRLECGNCIDAGSVYRVDALRQSRALETPALAHDADWTMARRVLRSAPWKAIKSDVPLHYRVRPGQQSQQRVTYAESSGLAAETVTIVIAFSGRWDAWRHMRHWLETQTWPRDQVRLLILDSSHARVTAVQLGLQDWSGASLQIERIDAGRKQLADAPRAGVADTFFAVECAVSSLYNKAVALADTEWILFVEDDVIPCQVDTIEKLLYRTSWNVACVSGLYAHRFERGAVAWHHFGEDGRTRILPWNGPTVEDVTGTGFGCLLARRSVLRRYVLSGQTGAQPHYDVSVSRRIKRDGLRWVLDRSVICNHLSCADSQPPELPEPEHRPNILMIGTGRCGSTVVTQMLQSLGWHTGECDQHCEHVALTQPICDDSLTADQLSEIIDDLPQPWLIKHPGFGWHPEAVRAAVPSDTLLLWITRDTNAVVRSWDNAGWGSDDTAGFIQDARQRCEALFESWRGRKLHVAFERLRESLELFDVTRGLQPS